MIYVIYIYIYVHTCIHTHTHTHDTISHNIIARHLLGEVRERLGLQGNGGLAQEHGSL